MSKKIEFEGEVREYAYSRDARGWTKDVSKVTIIAEGRLWEIIPNAPYRVTLEPIGPEPEPCPFCGGKAEVLRRVGNGWWVRCTERPIHELQCGGGPTEGTRREAVEAWNRRVERGRQR